MLPPRIVRRLVLVPLVFVIALTALLTLPLLALVAAVIAVLPVPGRRRPLRLVWFAAVWLAGEALTLAAAFGLWVASGFGGRLRTDPYQRRHYEIMRRFLDLLYRVATRVLGLRVEVDEPPLTPDEQAARLARPVIVLSRHAGPGDSFLLVHQLLCEYGRRPRVVMKATLQLDPGLDVVGNRLPNAFVTPSRSGEGRFVAEIERLASGLEPAGALVIFPEGGNWTPRRWRRSIDRLERLGRTREAARAKEMPHLLAPRPGGALAAIAACPTADVIFVAHAGLDDLVTVGDIWRNLPITRLVKAKWWRVPVDEVPRALDRDGQVGWLYDWWERIDAWIEENRPAAVRGELGATT
ncbi:MAG TPA: 1-acyl-sn-glycerol-3-phosphate acyltransferase [Actinomycetes bacterium]|nr:1-acyl-sn-glycerol-3-phosphate acyltransferase [Actinomycetes bacterium]